MRASGDPRTLQQLMADELFERLTGRSVVDGVDVEVGLVMTDRALFGGTSEADGADDDVAERPNEHTNRHRTGPADDHLAPDDVCPDGIRCASSNCALLHGSPDAATSSSSAGTSMRRPPRPAAPRPPVPSPPPSVAATTAARVWLRRLWIDPATGVLMGRDTRKRLFGGSLRAALIARDRTCRNSWCGAPNRAIDHKVRARDGGPTSDTNGQGLCQRCNNAREHPRVSSPALEEYRPPPVVLPAFSADRSPPSAA